MEILKEVVRDGNAFGVILYDNPSDEDRAEVQSYYNDAGSGLLTEDQMADLAVTSPENIFEQDFLSTHKKAMVWFQFGKPHSFVHLKNFCAEVAQKFESEGWVTVGGVEEPWLLEGDSEAEEAFAEWAIGNIQPSDALSERIFGDIFYLIFSKPDQPPKFSEEEQAMLKSRAREYAEKFFAQAA